MDIIHEIQSARASNFTTSQRANNPNVAVTSTENGTIRNVNNRWATAKPKELVDDHNISFHFYFSYSSRILIIHKMLQPQEHLVSEPIRLKIIEMLLLHQQKVI
jgi:hypothetical protein